MRMSRATLGLTLAGATLASLSWSLHWLIRSSLKAPRCVGSLTPQDHGLNFSQARIPTANGKQLAGWLIPSTRVGDRPALVILHGWGSNSEQMLPLARPFHAAGYTLLMIDARCHGHSDEDRFPSLPLFAEDLDHAIDWLRRQPGIAASEISVLGHSVGAGAALLSASRRNDLRAVVSVSAFAHPEGVIRRRLEAKKVLYRPFGWYSLRYIERFIGHRFDDMAPENTIAGVRCPVLLVHGRQDETVPVGDALRIHTQSLTANVDLLLVDGDHAFTAEQGRQISAIASLLSDWLRRYGAQPLQHDDGESLLCGVPA